MSTKEKGTDYGVQEWQKKYLFSRANSLCKSVQAATASIILEPLYWLSGPVLWTTLSQQVLSWCWPDAYRTLRFWRRLLPIYTRYITTKWQVRNKSYAEKDKVWAQTHEWGGKKVYELILDMSGFYVKSAQILASKAEFVPGAWTRHLSKLLDSAPPRPFHEVSRTIRQQLKESSWGASMQKHKVAPPLEAVFSDLEKAPLAAASIAQVHAGTLRDGTRIVVKVQHKGMETMMRSDLRNIVWLAKFLQGQLPVDLYPIVKEIQNTIPLEFNFEREVRFMGAIKGSMEANQVKQIVCPSSHTEYCTKKLIVMERIDGVPFTQIIHPSKGDLHPRLGEALQAVQHLLEAYGQMYSFCLMGHFGSFEALIYLSFSPSFKGHQCRHQELELLSSSALEKPGLLPFTHGKHWGSAIGFSHMEEAPPTVPPSCGWGRGCRQ
ncbi:hypothetical protein L7F22_060896 [Adiantum nelumboides]|nr:hypothetical protein [Adiantum nelumboides]